MKNACITMHIVLRFHWCNLKNAYSLYLSTNEKTSLKPSKGIKILEGAYSSTITFNRIFAFFKCRKMLEIIRVNEVIINCGI